VSWLSQLFRRKAPAADWWTGDVLSGSQFRAELGCADEPVDASYAAIRYESIPELYRWYKDQLFRLGVVRWDDVFDCDNFAFLFADLLCAKFAVDSWGRAPAQSPAVASMLYWPPGHVISAIRTDRGLVYLEPQTGLLVPRPMSVSFRCIF
jgi:hypothetical protein